MSSEKAHVRNFSTFKITKLQNNPQLILYSYLCGYIHGISKILICIHVRRLGINSFEMGNSDENLKSKPPAGIIDIIRVNVNREHKIKLSLRKQFQTTTLDWVYRNKTLKSRFL